MSDSAEYFASQIVLALEQLNAMHAGEDPFNLHRYNAITQLIEYWQERYFQQVNSEKK